LDPALTGRVLASLLATLPVLAALVLAGLGLLEPAAPGFPCRVLRNGAVPWLGSPDPGCPLRPYDRVLAVESAGGVRHGEAADELRRVAAASGSRARVLVSREGRVGWHTLAVRSDPRTRRAGRFAAAVLVAGALLSTALAIRWGSAAPAATPCLLLCASVSLAAVSVLCGSYQQALQIPGAIGSACIPAALAHLALTFPREREIVRRYPALVRGVHGLGALLCGISVWNLERAAAVWMLADRALAVLAILAWALLVVVCAVALRESSSALERARARVLLWGTLAVVAIPLAAASRGWAFGGALGMFSVSAGLLPLPIGYAIARYRLFDLGLAVRRGIAYLLYAVAASACAGAGLAAGAGLVGAPVPLGDPVLLFALAFVCFLAGEPLRARLRRAIDGWLSPSAARMRSALGQHAREMAQLLDPDECARRLCRTLRDGLAAESVCIFLAAGKSWRLVDAHGSSAALATDNAEAAALLLGAGDVLHLADEERHRCAACARLRALGVEAAARLHCDGATLGVALVGSSRSRLPYTSAHLACLGSALALTAAAVHRAGLARQLLAAERFATLGRVGAGLVHDLGKPLGVVEQLAIRLQGQAREPALVQSGARTIEALAGEMRASLRGVLGAAKPGAGAEEDLTIDALIDRAIRMVARGSASARVAVRLAPGLPRLRAGGDELARVLANLVDNALRASASADVVSVIGIEEAAGLCIEVSDRGCGMQAEVAARAFEPFFTTRGASGGSGLGLAICRDLVGALGGSIELDSAPGAGTRVRVRLPLPSREERAGGFRPRRLASPHFSRRKKIRPACDTFPAGRPLTW
jgi:signal transduction histidine kinase